MHIKYNLVGACAQNIYSFNKIIFLISDNTMETKDKVTSNGKANGNTTPTHPEDIEFPSIIELKKALPADVFKPELSKSFYYVGKDLTICLLLYAGLLIMEYQPSTFLRCVYTLAYWFFMGTFFWSIFVLGHDCGHGSFSANPVLNDIVGTFLHSLILVPFYQWKLSHRWHHRNTGNIDKEEIFYPIREKDCNKDFRPFKPAFLLGISWFLYLFTGYAPRKICHFNLGEEMFQNHVFGCTASLASLAFMLCCMFKYACSFGILALIVHYVIPVLVFASWLVVVTFLHHNEVEIPWYSDRKWDYVRGQVSSVDRHYGWAHELTHNIGTHQIHHLFIKIPHYHLEEASRHFQKAFPQLVRKCERPIMSSFFRMFKIYEEQRHIGNDVDIYMYKEKKE